MNAGMLAEALNETIASAHAARKEYRTYLLTYGKLATQDAAGFAAMARRALKMACDPSLDIVDRLDQADVARSGYRDAHAAAANGR